MKACLSVEQTLSPGRIEQPCKAGLHAGAFDVSNAEVHRMADPRARGNHVIPEGAVFPRANSQDRRAVRVIDVAVARASDPPFCPWFLRTKGRETREAASQGTLPFLQGPDPQLPVLEGDFLQAAPAGRGSLRAQMGVTTISVNMRSEILAMLAKRSEPNLDKSSSCCWIVRNEMLGYA